MIPPPFRRPLERLGSAIPLVSLVVSAVMFGYSLLHGSGWNPGAWAWIAVMSAWAASGERGGK